MKKTGKRPHEPLVKRWGAMKVKDITRRDVRELLEVWRRCSGCAC